VLLLSEKVELWVRRSTSCWCGLLVLCVFKTHVAMILQHHDTGTSTEGYAFVRAWDRVRTLSIGACILRRSRGESLGPKSYEVQARSY